MMIAPVCDLSHIMLEKNNINWLNPWEASMSLPGSDACDKRVVFLSYAVRDNFHPTGRIAHGFVNYLKRAVAARLQEEGVPDAILWQDSSQIEPGTVWDKEILNVLDRAELFIAILSKNYIQSSWCKRELDLMKLRVELLGTPAGERRIFRVDKQEVPKDRVPDPLPQIQSVPFYRNDGEVVDEFYWGGKVQLRRQYDKALLKLTSAISKRLEELGIPSEPKGRPEPQMNNVKCNGRVVFVAKPAGDMLELYQNLVEELVGRGFGITPDPDKDLGNRGEEVRSAVVKALAEAEVSIHMLGKRKGIRPDGLDMDLVPMQLAAAADEAKRRLGSFERLIWAPAVLPPEASARAKRGRRDPLKVLKGFGQQLLEADQIDSDTASRFNDFVLQRLERKRPSPRQAN
jgi:hypothetical protein